MKSCKKCKFIVGCILWRDYTCPLVNAAYDRFIWLEKRKDVDKYFESEIYECIAKHCSLYTEKETKKNE